MAYRRFQGTCIVRIQKEEELLEALEEAALVPVSRIGAASDATPGACNTKKFEYESRRFTGDMEIASYEEEWRALSAPAHDCGKRDGRHHSCGTC